MVETPRDALAAKYFPDEWAAVANVLQRQAGNKRARLRKAAENLERIERMKAVLGEDVIMSWKGMPCPLEARIEISLQNAKIAFTRQDCGNTHLDFHLTDHNIFLEIKRWHTPRIADQIERAPDVIVIQGGASVTFFEKLLSKAQA